MHLPWFYSILVTGLMVTFLIGPACLAVESAGSTTLFEQLDSSGDGLLNRAEIHSKYQRLFDRTVRQADGDQNGVLSLAEFLTGLTPRRPEKPFEQRPTDRLPGADSLRLLYLKMDINRDSIIEGNEVPVELLGVFDQLVETADRNGDDRLNSRELTASNAQLSRLSRRIVSRLEINVERELARLRRKQGNKFDRFDKQPNPRQMFRDAASSGEIFGRLDADGNGQVEFSEVPGHFGPLFQRLLRQADQNRDKKLSRREFVRNSGHLESLLEMTEGP